MSNFVHGTYDFMCDAILSITTAHCGFKLLVAQFKKKLADDYGFIVCLRIIPYKQPGIFP